MPDQGQILTNLDLSAEEEYHLHLERGRSALNAGNLVEAKTEIDKCLAQRPSESGALNLRALLLFKLEEYDDAIKIFEDLVQRFTDEPVLRTSLGLAYLKKNDFETAATHFEKAVALDGDYAKAQNYLGICFENLGRYEQAREAFLAGGSRSMAAKMDEKLGKPGAKKEETPSPEKIESVQEEVDKLMSEPDEEREATFHPVDVPAEQVAHERTPSPVLRNLNDLATRIDLQYGSDAPCALSEEGVLRIRGQGFARLDDTICYLGSLEFRPRYKRYKGKDLKTRFGSEDNPICELVGQGVLFLKPHGRFAIIPLEDEVIYLQEDRVWGFAGDLRWENGRLPGEKGSDLLLVQFKGSGHIAIRLDDSLRSIPISSELPALLRAPRVVGWYGEVVPRLTSAVYPGEEDTEPVVEIKGDGHVLFEMPLQEDGIR